MLRGDRDWIRTLDLPKRPQPPPGGSAAGQRRWLEVDARPPRHEWGGCAAFRSEWGGGGNRRRQAHKQGLAACGVLEVWSRGKTAAVPPKRDSQGMNPLSGCGQRPPFSPRDGCVNAVASWSAGRHASVPPARLPAVPDMQAPPLPTLSRDTPKIRRATLQRFCPQGQTASLSHTCSAPCPCGARQRRPTPRLCRRQALLVGLPPSIPATTPTGTNRSIPAPFVTGRGCVNTEPTALSAGAAGRHILPRGGVPMPENTRVRVRRERPSALAWALALLVTMLCVYLLTRGHRRRARGEHRLRRRRAARHRGKRPLTRRRLGSSPSDALRRDTEARIEAARYTPRGARAMCWKQRTAFSCLARSMKTRPRPKA